MQAELQKAFNFTPEDLSANQAGRISSRQITVMRREVQNLRVFIFAAPAILAGIIGLILAWDVLVSGEPVVLVQVICLIQLSLVMSAIVWRGMRQMVRESVAEPDDEVIVISGMLTSLNTGGPTGTSLEIDRNFVPITRSQYDVLKKQRQANPQQVYNVYYVHGNLRVLAVEAVAAD